LTAYRRERQPPGAGGPARFLGENDLASNLTVTIISN
jgi:hypothetical protein